jgi:hypothetical protein
MAAFYFPAQKARARVMAQCLLWDYLGHLGMSTVSRDDSGVPADEDRRTIPTIC